MSRRAALAAVVSLLLSGVAHAQPWRVEVLSRAPGSEVFVSAPVQARVGQPVTLAAVAIDARGEVLGPPITARIGRRLVHPREGVAAIRWLRVVPRMEHVELAPPNRGVASFSNAVLFGPRHGRWLGFDRLEYETRALTTDDATVDAQGLLTVSGATLAPSREGAGSTWWSAEVTLASGESRRSADGATVDRLGLSRRVARVSFRSDDSYLGWLSTYFGVPDVFGSNGAGGDHQTDRYTGADCADVLVGALRARGDRVPRYLSVAEIGEAARRMTGTLVLDGAGALRATTGQPVTLRWGRDVSPGDVVTLGYDDDPGNSLPRAWDHIGVLVRDDGDGVLGGGDVLRHMSGHGLDDAPFLHAGPMRVVLWRWRAESGATRARAAQTAEVARSGR